MFWRAGPFQGRSAGMWMRLNQGRVRLKPDGTRWRTGGEVKGKLANEVCGQYSHTTSERGVSNIANADVHNSAASSRLNWRPRRFKWTRPFRRKTKPGFWACAITFQTHYTSIPSTLRLLFLISLVSLRPTRLETYDNKRKPNSW